MAGHESAVAIEDSRINENKSSVLYDFWFDLQSYVDASWLESTDLSEVLLGDNKKNSCSWRLLYRNICHELNIPSEWDFSNSYDEFWNEFISKTVLKPVLPMTFLGGSMRVGNDLMLANYEDIINSGLNDNTDIVLYPKETSIDLSLPQKKMAFHAQKCFSLDRRFKSLMVADDISTGLCFLYKSLSKEHYTLWRRVRLLYNKASIEFIEKYAEGEVLSAASYRSLKRLLRFTNENIL